jgi:hypothetical protein
MFFMKLCSVEEGGKRSPVDKIKICSEYIYAEGKPRSHNGVLMPVREAGTDRVGACSCGLAFFSNPSSNKYESGLPVPYGGTYLMFPPKFLVP